MEQQINPQEMMSMIVKLQAQVNKLQEEFEDNQLTTEDIEALEQAEKEYQNGETISHEELKKELEL